MKNKLNEYNDRTKKVIHLLITPLCVRDCKHCCNKQYNINEIPYITDAELKQCEVLCLTGGEPFLFSNPVSIAIYYKTRYKNIKNVYVYTNSTELEMFLSKNKYLDCIDGLNVSIKNGTDKVMFERIVSRDAVKKLTSNRLYVFDDLTPKDTGNFEVYKREWQEEFKPADDSIFRRI